MIALDTNVVVRLLTGDDARQSRKVVRLLAENETWVAKSALLETEWVLRRAYELSPEVIGEAFRKLLGLPTLAVEDEPVVAAALEAHASGVDFADALHVASSGDAEAFVTFDRRLVRAAKRAQGLSEVRGL